VLNVSFTCFIAGVQFLRKVSPHILKKQRKFEQTDTIKKERSGKGKKEGKTEGGEKQGTKEE
jgi:hypothetical protein